MTLIATRMAFEKRYSDDSGIEFSVRLNDGNIEMETVCNQATFPVEQIDWIIAALARIKAEIAIPDEGAA